MPTQRIHGAGAAPAVTAALLLTLCILAPTSGAPRAAAPAPPAPEFTVEDVGFNANPNLVLVQPAINPLGQVAGPSQREPGGPVTAPPGAQPGLPPAFFDAHRTNATLTFKQDLFVASFGSSPPTNTLGFFYNNAFGINFNPTQESAQVVGEAQDSSGRIRPFRFTDTASPKMEDLGTLGGDFGSAHGINSDGQVTGEAELDAPKGPRVSPSGFSAETHAFRYTDGPGMQDLGTLSGGAYSVGYGINEAGQVAGVSEVLNPNGGGPGIPEYQQHAFLYSDGTGMQDLGTLPGDVSSAAYDLNDHNPVQVVGNSVLFAGKYSAPRATRWQSGAKLNLGLLPGDSSSSATAINDAGTIVGWSNGDGNRPFIWRDKNSNNQSDVGELQDLNTLIPADSGWVLETATDINDAGQIVGTGLLNGVFRVFRLTPITPNQPPQLSNPGVTPPTRPAAGGNFTLSVTATDDRGLTSVIADVNLPGGGTQTVTLARQGTTNVFAGVFTAPANGGTTAQNYTATFRATDTDDVTTSLALPGSFSVLGESGDNQPPQILDCSLTPQFLPRRGGPVTITAQVTDDAGVARVEAQVTQPDNNVVVVPLAPTGGNHYAGTYDAPANLGEGAVLHSVDIYAEDTSENPVTEHCGEVRLAGAAEAPTGSLVVEPPRLSFGKVKVRRSKTLVLTIRHQGGSPNSVIFIRPGGLNPPFEAGPPLTAAGTTVPAVPSGGWIPLLRGEARRIRVTFRPLRLGTYIDTLPIETSLPDRPLVRVLCAGKGCRTQ